MPPVNPTNIPPQVAPQMQAQVPMPVSIQRPVKKSGGRAIFRTLIILLVVGGIGYAGYKMFLQPKVVGTDEAGGGGLVTTAGVGTGTSAVPDTSSQSINTASSEQIGNEFLATLLSVKSIKIDSAIFTSTAFTSLQDFSRPLLPDNNPGRPNPFAPLGADTTTISTQISTTNVSKILTTTATLNGTLTIADQATLRWFEYGTTQTLGNTTNKKNQTTPGTFAETVSGLLPNTLYYVKAMATYSGQTIAGNIISFRTAQAIR